MSVANKKAYEVIRRKSDFETLSRIGKRAQHQSWILARFQRNDQSKVRIGWTVSGQVGNAVTRNRLKRKLREFLRLDPRAKSLSSVDIHFIFRRQRAGFYQELSNEDFNRGVGALVTEVCRRG